MATITIGNSGKVFFDLKGREVENTTSGTVTGDTYTSSEIGIAGDCFSSDSSYVDVIE